METEFVVMIIDDDEDDRAIFFDAVKQVCTFARCVSATNGQEALDLLKSNDFPIPDFIFLDLNMPRLTGMQCLEELKKIERVRGVPVIIYSTTQRPEDVAETKRLGAVKFITKPTLYKDICREIAAVIAPQ